MSPKKNRSKGARPTKSGRADPISPKEVSSTSDESPVFCLAFCLPDKDVTNLSNEQKADFAESLQKRARMTWTEITLADKHGLGSELIDVKSLKRSLPRKFEGTQKVLALRYSGKLPMLGIRVGSVFHILMIDTDFTNGASYDHGS